MSVAVPAKVETEGTAAHQEGQGFGRLAPHRLLQRRLDARLEGGVSIKVGGGRLGLCMGKFGRVGGMLIGEMVSRRLAARACLQPGAAVLLAGRRLTDTGCCGALLVVAPLTRRLACGTAGVGESSAIRVCNGWHVPIRHCASHAQLDSPPNKFQAGSPHSHRQTPLPESCPAQRTTNRRGSLACR